VITLQAMADGIKAIRTRSPVGRHTTG
jgi:hypothetical protein